MPSSMNFLVPVLSSLASVSDCEGEEEKRPGTYMYSTGMCLIYTRALYMTCLTTWFVHCYHTHWYYQEYIIEGRESILLHYSTVYHPFTGSVTLVVFCGFTVYMAIIVVLHVLSLVALAAVLCTAM